MNSPQTTWSVRPARESDARDMLAIYAPFVRDTAVSFELEVPSPEEFRRRVLEGQRAHPWLVAEDSGGVRGYAYATSHRTRAAYRWSVDVSVYVADGFRSRGLGRALYGELFDRLREQGFFKAYAGICLPNAASVALHEALGFESVGIYREVGFKLGAWHDVGWWVLALGEMPEQPLDPRSTA
jgi:L-amino acid N-acyltransferase YncA